jgi:hypothetical protein
MRLFYRFRFFIGVLLIGITTISIAVASASAQEMMQGAPPIAPAPQRTYAPLPPSNPEMQIPQQAPQQPYVPPPTPARPPPIAMPPINMPMLAPQPVLPPVFRGCWQGTVESVDSIERAPGGHKLGYWTPKSYRLCYKRVGDGPYQLTFGETNIVATQKVKYSRGRVEIRRTDGRSYAELRAFLHFDEYAAGDNYVGATFAVDESTILECRIDGDQMQVIADVDGRREDEPWFRAHWRTTFIRAPM